MGDATGYEDFDELVSGEETGSGKHFCVNVPDYTDSANNPDDTEGTKQTYMRLGAAETDWKTEPGADLAALGYLVGVAGIVRSGDGDYTLDESDNVVSALNSNGDFADITADDIADPYVDDQRERGTGADRPDGPHGHGLSTTERRAKTAKLHSNVGWRDHTDGNRITTTRGDKLEVVYGNYKVVVMGRQIDPAEAMAWDVTGNHIQDFAGGTMPGASVTLEWVADSTYGQQNGSDGTPAGGAWLLQNSTERVYQYSRNAGNFKEENWGDLLETYTGSENPEQFGTSADSGMQGHPKYRDEALGKSDVLCPQVDSTDIPRGNPTIVEKTWAQKITSHTGSAAWKVPKIEEETWVKDATAKTMAETIFETKEADFIVEYTKANRLHFTGELGPVIEIFVGAKYSMALAGTIDIFAPFKFEASFGFAFSYHNFKDEMNEVDNKISNLESSLATAEQKIRVTKSSLSKLRTDINDTKTTLDTTKIEIGQMKVDIRDNTTLAMNTSVKLANFINHG